MSLQETAPLPLPHNLFTKPKPPVPQKPSPRRCPPPPPTTATDRGSGKVKRIVSQFRQQERGGGLRREPKRAPTVKPKPPRAAHPGGSAPPLPEKKSRTLRENAGGGGGGGEGGGGTENRLASAPLCENEGRSDPDGSMVEAEPEPEISPGEEAPVAATRLHCEKDCRCLCHHERPGMRLQWVPIESAEVEDEEEDTAEEEGGEEQEGLYEVTLVGGASDSAQEEEESLGRSSDSEAVQLMRYTTHGSPESSGRPVTPQLERQEAVEKAEDIKEEVKVKVKVEEEEDEEEEEEDIYETSLDPAPNLEQEAKPIPIICVTKPPRRSQEKPALPSSSSSSVEQEDPPPPAVPPRVPLLPTGARQLRPTSVPAGGRLCGLPVSLGPNDRPPNKTTPPLARKTQIYHHCRQPPLPPTHRMPPRDLSQDADDEIGSDWEKVEHDEEEEEQPRPPPTLPRTMSIDWEKRLQEEPFYQTYRATVISKEIRRQTVCRNISKTSQDFSAERLSMGPNQSSLWQDMPSVRDSGMLGQVTPEECKRQESMFEVLTSEASYLRSLRVLTSHFMESRELDETLIIREKKTLFSNIQKVSEISERFLKDLEEEVDRSLLINDICHIIHYHAQHNFNVYIDYVRNQIYQEKTYSALMQKNSQFATVIARLQESPQCQRLPFMSFLLLPFQRITRIKMLIENILKRTEEGTEKERTASKALASVSKIIEECNSEVGKMKQTEELIHIAQTLEFDKLKAVPIICKNRYLEKRGELQELVRGSTLFSLRLRFSPVYLFLFNDLMLITSKKSAERYVVIDHAHRSLVQAQQYTGDLATTQGLELCFSLTLLENHQGKMMEHVFKAPTQSDLDRWMAVFPNPGEAEKPEEETVYEDWDCPQVQCIEQYVAQQADELSLEPTDIVNILRKTNEGWYEGSTLSDGRKGWFPGKVVLEITNEHVRRRNLRERFRVMQAATQITTTLKSKTGP
ncbi:ephexin-1 [Amia ocellicauda]|uniref:ephexin-1 n=1 Tax=Amia ocellicauda TaxID=2972642 RepID=UPI00346395CC